MDNKKINVIPTAEQIRIANEASLLKDNEQVDVPYQKTSGEVEAEMEMLRRTAEQLKAREKMLTKQEEPKSIIEAPQNQVKQNQVKQEKVKVPKSIINEACDNIPLPSGGLIYPHKKSHIMVSMLTTMDENILTAPHLLESGEFINVLMDRKILDPDISHKDLHVGDRNAIMLWLRATAYGNEYSTNVINPYNGELIEVDVDLADIKVKKLGAVPDRNGYFDFTLPVSKDTVKFKFLTVSDTEEISEERDYQLNTLNYEYATTATDILEKHIVEYNGNRDKEYIKNVVSIMRVGDSRALRKYINEIESGMDMNIEVQIPGGGSFTTFLPIDTTFFWPEL
jgi:hypothetical protein